MSELNQDIFFPLSFLLYYKVNSQVIALGNRNIREWISTQLLVVHSSNVNAGTQHGTSPSWDATQPQVKASLQIAFWESQGIAHSGRSILRNWTERVFNNKNNTSMKLLQWSPTDEIWTVQEHPRGDFYLQGKWSKQDAWKQLEAPQLVRSHTAAHKESWKGLFPLEKPPLLQHGLSKLIIWFYLTIFH